MYSDLDKSIEIFLTSFISKPWLTICSKDKFSSTSFFKITSRTSYSGKLSVSFWSFLNSALGAFVIILLGITSPIGPKNSDDLFKSMVKAFVFGLVAYGTYNLTNMATVKGWSPSVVFVDMLWGGLLTAFSSYFGASTSCISCSGT